MLSCYLFEIFGVSGKMEFIGLYGTLIDRGSYKSIDITCCQVVGGGIESIESQCSGFERLLARLYLYILSTTVYYISLALMSSCRRVDRDNM